MHPRDPRWPVDRIILHVEQGSHAGTIQTFQHGSIATHFVISQRGETVQMVLESKMCWHCGSYTQRGWNERSIGIEHEGWITDTFPEVMLKASAALVADICRRRKIPADRVHIMGHCEIPGVTHTDPGPNWPWKHYMELVAEAFAALT